MKAILFDLDNTLYAPESNLFGLIDRRINRYMEEVVTICPTQVDELRRSYWREYGATLQGLIRHYDIDPEDYLDYVHDVDVSERLKPDTDLRCGLRNLPSWRYVFTNGSQDYARRVLGALGLEEEFEEIFDIRIAGYQPKPRPEPYHGVLDALGVKAADCVMVEDSLPNLSTAKGLGMVTVLVGQNATADYIDYQVATALEATHLVASLF